MNQYYLVNGKRKKFSQGKEIYILDLVNEIFGSKKKKQLAVALNFKLVCKSKWRSTKIKQKKNVHFFATDNQPTPQLNSKNNYAMFKPKSLIE